MNSKQNQKNSKLPVMGIPAQPVKPNYRRTFPQVHSYAAKVDSYGTHLNYNRDRQVYDNFKLNAHVYPLDALGRPVEPNNLSSRFRLFPLSILQESDARFFNKNNVA